MKRILFIILVLTSILKAQQLTETITMSGNKYWVSEAYTEYYDYLSIRENSTTISIWNMISGTQVARYAGTDATFSVSNSAYMINGSFYANFYSSDNSKLKIINIKTGTVFASFTFPSINGYSINGAYSVVASDKKLRFIVWYYKSGSDDRLYKFYSSNISITSMQSIAPVNIPAQVSLSQNYPNPFNPSTTINYSIDKQNDVKINIYDINGRLIKTLEENDAFPGEHNVIWDGTNTKGERVSSGTYLYQLNAGSTVENKKMILLK